MDRGLYLKAAVQARDAFSLFLKGPPAMRGRSRGSGGRTLRPLLLIGCNACNRSPILSRYAALMGWGVSLSIDARSSMPSGYQPRRRVGREGERERPGEIDYQNRPENFRWRWIHEVALIDDSFLANFQSGGGEDQGAHIAQ